MSYNGSVELIAGITQANNQDYPLVHVHAVYVDDDTRLDGVLDQIASDISDLKYVPMAINSFTVTPNECEIDATLNSVELKFNLNKVPTVLKRDNTVVEPAKSGTWNIGGTIVGNTTFKIDATDERDLTKSATAKITSKPKIFWGAAVEPTTIDNTFLNTLNSKLATDFLTTFTANAVTGRYIWFACPHSFGTPKFYSGGFSGGINKVGTTTRYNSNMTYDIYRSDYDGLGLTQIEIRNT